MHVVSVMQEKEYINEPETVSFDHNRAKMMTRYLSGHMLTVMNAQGFYTW